MTQPSFKFSAFLLLLIHLLLATGCQENKKVLPPPKPLSVPVQNPIVREIIDYDEYTGRSEAVQTVDIRARVNGYITKVAFKDGSDVKQGDLLFVIDQRDYQAALDKANGDLGQALAKLKLAESDLARAETLRQGSAISQEEYDTKASNKIAATAAVQSAQASVNTAKLNMDYTQITAPISGRISRALITMGNLVSASDILTNIVTIDPLYVYVDADENSILKYAKMAREGTRKSARDGFQTPVEMGLANEEGYPHAGYVDFVDNRIEASTGTMRARAVLPNPNHDMAPGLFVRLRVPGSGNYQATLISDKAIGSDQGQKFVYVIDSTGKVEYRHIKTGPVFEGMRVIREGLTSTDQVITGNLQMLRPGAPVVALPPSDSKAPSSPSAN